MVDTWHSTDRRYQAIRLFGKRRSAEKRKEAAGDLSLRPLPYVCCGGVLLSHNLAVAVPLALPGLASRFGMEAGRFPGAMTTTSLVFNTLPRHGLVGVWVDRGLYSGCGCFAGVFLFTRFVGCCLVLAH